MSYKLVTRKGYQRVFFCQMILQAISSKSGIAEQSLSICQLS